MAALLFLQAAPPAAESYLADFLRTLLALAGVLALGWFGLRQLARRGFGRPGKHAGAVHVIARIPLEARKSLYVVRAGTRVLLLGTGESGPPSLIAELDPGSESGSESESGENRQQATGNRQPAIIDARRGERCQLPVAGSLLPVPSDSEPGSDPDSESGSGSKA